jgi:hypothetical protein
VRAAGVALAGVIFLAAAGCEPGFYYGASGGVAAPVRPSQAGGFASMSARREYEPPPRSLGSYFGASGDLVGFASTDSRGLVPLLVGSGGGKFGPMRLYLEGGVQLPGYLERFDHRVFAIFGLVGGLGVGVFVNEYFELHLTGRILWSSPSTQVDIQAGRKAEFLYLLSGLTVFIRPIPAPNRPVEEPF